VRIVPLPDDQQGVEAMAMGFRCVRCLRVSQAPRVQRCEVCGGIMEPSPRSPAGSSIAAWTDEPSMWRYASSLSVAPQATRVSLGEGRTPLINAPRLAERIGIRSLVLKLELVNPTGSFKDRALSAVATHGRYHQAAGLVGSSSGNALHAQAAYAALAGLPSLAVVPETVSLARLAQPLHCGTRVLRVKGDFSVCHQVARDIASISGWYNASTTYENPIGVDAYKTVAFEIWEDAEFPVDWIGIPVGAGPLLGAIARAFAEVARLGRREAQPALLGVQAAHCAPIAAAYEKGSPCVIPWEGNEVSVAKGIADPLRGYAEDGTYTLSAVRSSGGAVIAVGEREILEASQVLARTCGLHADPAAAAAIAGLHAAVRSGRIPAHASAIAIITGTGFKETPSDAMGLGRGDVFDPSVDRIESILPKEASHDETPN